MGCMVLPYAGEGRAIPRVDTFASNLHDSWGAHALHDSPPATEEAPFQHPPRLSIESARSAPSQASKASSGEHFSFLPFSCGPHAIVWTQSSHGFASSRLQSRPLPPARILFRSKPDPPLPRIHLRPLQPTPLLTPVAILSLGALTPVIMD